MISTTQAVLIILVTALVTLLTRVLPFVIFGRREIPVAVRYLGNILPPSIMAILVIYCIRSIDLLSGTHGLPELIAIAVVVILHLWKRNNLLSIGVGTVCYMILVQAVFV